jgi:putative endonuclease
MFYVYVLEIGKTGRRYVGSCGDLDERIQRHNLGHSKATRHGIPWRLRHSETFLTRKQAPGKEAILQNRKGRDQLDRFSL